MSTNNLYQGIATAYNMCQDVGDVLSILGGGAEISNGLGEVVAGVVGTPETAGLLLTISGKGVLDVTHGSVMAFSGGKNFLSQKGRVKESGGSGSQMSETKPEYKKPKSGSGKDKADDVPGWAKGERPYQGENGKDFAKRVLEKRLGKDANYKTGPTSDYNRIKKWGDRGFE